MAQSPVTLSRNQALRPTNLQGTFNSVEIVFPVASCKILLMSRIDFQNLLLALLLAYADAPLEDQDPLPARLPAFAPLGAQFPLFAWPNVAAGTGTPKVLSTICQALRFNERARIAH